MRRATIGLIMLICIAMVGLGGCLGGSSQPQGKSTAQQLREVEAKMKAALKHEMAVPFSAKDAAYINKKGTNTILGQGMSKTRGGNVKTSAGNKAYVYPVTEYTTEMMTLLFQDVNSGHRMYVDLGGEVVKREVTNIDPELTRYVKEQTCDAQGNFEFLNLPNGEYFVVTTVTWEVPTRYSSGTQGGDLMKRVKVTGGSKERVILAR